MNRRKFLSASGAALAASACGNSGFFGQGTSVHTSSTTAWVVNSPPLVGGNSFYVGNRAPLVPSPLMKLPIGTTEPKGWLRQQLLLMVDGMIGRLAENSKFLYANSGWLTFNKQKEVEYDDDYQDVPYWLRGYGDLGYVLKDELIIREARRWLEATLNHQEEDGYFGPPANKMDDDLWPNMPMLNALQSFYEATGDNRVLSFMSRYFRYELSLPRDKLLPQSWQKFRGGDNLASVYWLYNRTGENWLLDLAKALHEQTVDWTSVGPHASEVSTWAHGVNITEGFREPASYYQQSKDHKFLEATERDYAIVMDEYGQVPGGMFGADENIRPGYTGASQAAETCSMVEFMQSFEMLLKITGNPAWADRCEDVAFNSLPAALTPDLKGLHYLTAPNLVQCDPSKEHVFDNKLYMLPYSPREVYSCCQHNVAMGWPYYSEHLWLATEGNGLAAVLYAPSSVEAQVGHGVRVKIEEETAYPFGETVELKLASPEPVHFPLLLRIPKWCEGATVTLNGEKLSVESAPLSYVVVEQTWHDGDRVTLRLPMKVTLSVWPKQGNAVSVNRGPLTYSLKIGQKWEKIGGSDEWPDSAVYPTTPWNIGLIVDRANPSASFRVVQKVSMAKQPFDLETAPVELRGKGRVIPEWRLVQNSAGPLPLSPVSSGQPDQDITLVPMGCARLRISVFPTIG